MRAPQSLRARWPALVLTALWLSLSPALGAAEEPSVEHKEQVIALYQVARQLLDAGRTDEACAVLEQGRRLDPRAINLLLRLGDCLARAGKTASAWSVFLEAGAVARGAGDPREARAAELAKALEPRLSRLQIAVPAADAVAGLEVLRDGELVPRAQWGQAIPVDPGVHTIEARAPGKERWSTSRTVATGGARVVVKVPRLADRAPRRRDDAPSGRSALALTPATEDERAGDGRAQRVLALVSGGAGLVGLGVGAVLGVEAIAKRDASNRGHCDAQHRCDAAGVALRSEAQAAGTGSTIAFSAGATALLAAGVLWWTAPSRPTASPSQPTTSPARPTASPARPAASPAGVVARPPDVAAVVGPGAFGLVLRGSY